MTLSITLNPAHRNLSVRTRSFSRRSHGEVFNPPPYLSIEFERGPRSGVGHQTIPSWNEVILVVEVSHTNMSKLYDYALSHMWVNVVAQSKIGCHSTRTLCIFHKHSYFPFLHFNTDISAFHNHTSIFKGVLNKQYLFFPSYNLI